MDLIVTPAVLIPRPETEHLVETLLALAADKKSSPGKNLRIVDVGTGSGCIALALAKEFPRAEIRAIEVSESALEIARANAARHGLERRVTFHQADLLAGFDLRDFDFVVSNPPYVGESEEDQVQLEVRKFEPRKAVFAGHEGTEVIARLIPQAESALRTGGWLVLEVSGSIAGRVQRLLGAWDEVRAIPDLQSIPRIVQARKR
jgi:release factor glutamine methyltransferase